MGNNFLHGRRINYWLQTSVWTTTILVVLFVVVTFLCLNLLKDNSKQGRSVEQAAVNIDEHSMEHFRAAIDTALRELTIRDLLHASDHFRVTVVHEPNAPTLLVEVIFLPEVVDGSYSVLVKLQDNSIVAIQ